MTGVILGLVAMAIVPLAFLTCPTSLFSCRAVQSVSVLFGGMALLLTVALLMGDWRNKRKAKQPDEVE